MASYLIYERITICRVVLSLKLSGSHHLFCLKEEKNLINIKKSFRIKKNQNKPIILMGDKANTVSVVGKLFKENGFEEVFCLDGGIESWIDAGLPVRSAEK